LLVAAALGAPASAGGQVLQGTLRELMTQRALSGVSVSLLDERDSVLRVINSDIRGGFRFGELAPNAYSISLRAIGYEPMTTTPIRVGARDTIVLAFTLERSVVSLDTVRVRGAPLSSVTSGRAQFLEHYRRGVGLFISGAEIAAAHLSVAAYVAKLPGFQDFGANKGPATNANSCQGVNEILRGGNPSMSLERVTAGNGGMDADDFCSLMDENGRRVFPVDAPCMITQVDRLGWVRRVIGTDLVVQPLPKTYTPNGIYRLGETDSGARPEMLVHLREVIGVEFYRTPQEIPPTLRIRGNVPELEAKISRCGLIQFWTRTAW